MSHISEAPIGGKFRAVADTTLDGVDGTFGDDDILPVTLDAAGELVVATATACHGVVWTREGRAGESTAKTLIGGRTYTVITRGQFAGMEVGVGTFTAGDNIYAQAAGAVATGPTGAGADAKSIGTMVTDNILVVDVGLLAPGLA